MAAEPTETFGRYDAADYLTTPGHAAAYLEVALEEAGDDAGIIAQALAEDGNPSFATVLKVTRALGLDLKAAARA